MRIIETIKKIFEGMDFYGHLEASSCQNNILAAVNNKYINISFAIKDWGEFDCSLSPSPNARTLSPDEWGRKIRAAEDCIERALEEPWRHDPWQYDKETNTATAHFFQISL